jgi:DNA-binding MarR family transcriptional regulator
MNETRWLSDEEREAWKSLSLMQLQLTARLGRQLSGCGLSYQDYLVLASLTDRELGSSRVVELACELGWEKSRASHHLTRMSERGLIRKEPCPTDQRGSYVVITEEGRRAIAAAAPGHVDAVRREFIDLLTSEQLSTIDQIAHSVLEHLGRGDLDSVEAPTSTI